MLARIRRALHRAVPEAEHLRAGVRSELETDEAVGEATEEESPDGFVEQVFTPVEESISFLGHRMETLENHETHEKIYRPESW